MSVSDQLVKRSFLTLSLLNRQGQVSERSGLNWWNAGGRPRKLDEVYIPLPSHHGIAGAEVFGGNVAGTRFHAWLVSTNEWLILRLEGTSRGESRQAKQITSDGNKCLLGYWMLRECLQVPVRHVVTLQDLEAYGRTYVTFTRMGTDPQTGWARVEVSF